MILSPTATPDAADARACVLLPYGLELGRGRVAGLDPRHLSHALMEAVRLGYRQVWVSPPAADMLGLPVDLDPVPADRQADAFRYGQPHPVIDQLAELGWRCSTDPPGLNPWLGLTWTEREVWVDLVSPQWDPRNPFDWRGGAAALLEALDLYAQQMGLRYRRSPGATGMRLMRSTHSDHLALRNLGEPPPPALQPMDGEAAGEWVGNIEPLPNQWVHAFDINGMFLAACSSVELGAGATRHVDRPPVDIWRWPGYWRGKIGGTAAIRPPFKIDGREHWYTTPSLVLAWELGLAVEVSEGWVYEARHRWLAAWYARLRDARATLMGLPLMGCSREAREMTSTAIKRTYTQTLGWLGGHWLRSGDEAFRPDWRAAIVARARANMYRHLYRVHHVAGQLPVGLSADTVLYLSPEQDGRQLAAALGLQISPQLGKWKHVGSMPAHLAYGRLRGVHSARQGLRAILDALGAEVEP